MDEDPFNIKITFVKFKNKFGNVRYHCYFILNITTAAVRILFEYNNRSIPIHNSVTKYSIASQFY